MTARLRAAYAAHRKRPVGGRNPPLAPPPYLQNTLHALDAQRGLWNAIFAASFIPTFTLFGLLCRYVPLRTLL